MAKLVKLCFIRRSFFEIHSDYIKILDVGSPQKQSQRTHLCVVIKKDDNHFFIPLRNNLGDAVRKYGRIGHSVPSEMRKRAGLDYRYALIVNDWEYVEDATERRIPKRQLKQIENDYDEIFVFSHKKAFLVRIFHSNYPKHIVNISYVSHSGKIVSKVSFSMHSANNMDGKHIRNML